MHFADQGGVLALIRLLLARGESGHSQLFEILPDIKHWCLSLSCCGRCAVTDYLYCSFSERRYRMKSCYKIHHCTMERGELFK